MTAYALVTLTITNPDSFAEYRDLAGPALAKYSAKPFARSGEAEVIEGDIAAPTVTVILEFPDRAAAQGWINDPDLAHVHEKRRNSGRSNIILM